MICPKCGRNIPDGSLCPCSAGPVLSSNPALNALKSIGSSPLFAGAAVLFSLSTLFSLMGGLFSSIDYTDLYYAVLYLHLDGNELVSLLDMMNGVSVVGAVLGNVPGILVAVSLWLMYASSRNTHTGNVSTAGITICKVLAVIQLVFTCLAAAFVLLALAVVFFAAVAGEMDDVGYEYGFYFGEFMAVFCVVLLVAVIIAFTLAVLYQACVIKTCSRIKATALTGVPDNRIPSYLIVMNYITAVVGVFGSIGFLMDRPLTSIAALVNAAGLIVLSIALNQYRSRMTILMYPPVQPVYSQPPVPPQY